MITYKVTQQMRYARKDKKAGKGLGWNVLKTDLKSLDDAYDVVHDAMKRNKAEYPDNKFDYRIIKITEASEKYWSADYSPIIPLD